MFDINKCPKDDDGNLLAQTRDGRSVTLITANGREPEPLVGWIGNSYAPSSWLRDGSYHQSKDRSSFDLTNIPEPKRSGEVWVFGKRRGDAVTFGVSGCAPVGDVVFQKTVPWTEGEGLEGK